MSKAPSIYIPHGGGPLPLLGEPGHDLLVQFLKILPERFEKPSAIIVVSAHWEEPQVTVQENARPRMLFDYSNFPAAAYEFDYPVLGDPRLAQKIQWMLAEQLFTVGRDSQRGIDHGAFVPLMLMYPDADIPCIEVSLLSSMDPAKHIALGRALAPLREQGVMILGSGSSYHNMQKPRVGIDPSEEDIATFDQWLIETCADPILNSKQREKNLLNWLDAPHARFCHPREEHLLPLHVCFGAAFSDDTVAPAEKVFDDPMMGRTMLSFLWH